MRSATLTFSSFDFSEVFCHCSLTWKTIRVYACLLVFSVCATLYTLLVEYCGRPAILPLPGFNGISMHLEWLEYRAVAWYRAVVETIRRSRVDVWSAGPPLAFM